MNLMNIFSACVLLVSVCNVYSSYVTKSKGCNCGCDCAAGMNVKTLGVPDMVPSMMGAAHYGPPACPESYHTLEWGDMKSCFMQIKMDGMLTYKHAADMCHEAGGGYLATFESLDEYKAWKMWYLSANMPDMETAHEVNMMAGLLGGHRKSAGGHWTAGQHNEGYSNMVYLPFPHHADDYDDCIVYVAKYVPWETPYLGIMTKPCDVINAEMSGHPFYAMCEANMHWTGGLWVGP